MTWLHGSLMEVELDLNKLSWGQGLIWTICSLTQTSPSLGGQNTVIRRKSHYQFFIKNVSVSTGNVADMSDLEPAIIFFQTGCLFRFCFVSGKMLSVIIYYLMLQPSALLKKCLNLFRKEVYMVRISLVFKIYVVLLWVCLQLNSHAFVCPA